MSGPNQHHIPQFLQRAFGVKPKGKRSKQIWEYRLDAEPKLNEISKTASGDFFYSYPSSDGDKTLDQKITDAENPLSDFHKTIRAQSVGSEVEANLAAEFVAHFAVRSSHIRVSFADGLRHMLARASDVFTDRARLAQIIGIDQDEPSDNFRENLKDLLSNNPEFAFVGIPPEVLERVAFYIARESFERTSAETIPLAARAFEDVALGLSAAARNGHNRALEEIHEKNVRRELLSTFGWTIDAAPAEGAILPDCIAVAHNGHEHAQPLMFIGEDMDVVIMPITTDKMLIGRREPDALFASSKFNRDAAACCHEFFLANADRADFRALSDLIGSRTRPYFEEATRSAFSSFLPASRTAQQGGVPSTETSTEIAPLETDLRFEYQISCHGFATEDSVYQVVDAVGEVISAFARMLPLVRLDGITFASDYPAALREVDRGRADLSPIENIDSKAGAVGLAQTVSVVRGGQVKGRVVINSCVGGGLIGEDLSSRDWALNVLVDQLGLVAMLEIIERTLPGTLLNPIQDEFHGIFYNTVHAALTGYVAAFFCAGFGNPQEIGGCYRGLLVAALDRMKTEIEVERLSYRKHGNVDQLLAVALPVVGHVLHLAAKLLGHCASNGCPLYDAEGALSNALDRCNLTHWLADFGRDLERFQCRIGVWSSFDEFLAFTRHVERILWSVGLFPWRAPEGIRVEVPLIFDAGALIRHSTEEG